MAETLDLGPLWAELAGLAPMGYSASLHIHEAVPLLARNCYPKSWIEQYRSHSYFLRDPLIFWGIGVEGVTRWSEIRMPDPYTVLKKAAVYGLIYGVVASFGPISSRSIVSVARKDREFTPDELAKVQDLTLRLHVAAKPRVQLTKPQQEALELVARGLRHAEAAQHLGITPSAFKARLQLARQRLDARTTTEALRKAREYHLL